MTNDDDLRTALTKLAELYASYGGNGVANDINALLAAHPAPETDDRDTTLRAYRLSAEGSDRYRMAAPVSDTRREDVARALRMTQATHPDDQARLARWWDEGLTSPEDRAVVLRQADAVLAVLPALPVVDEAEVRERIAQDIEAEAERMILTSDAWTSGEERHLDGLGRAVRIARGATR